MTRETPYQQLVISNPLEDGDIVPQDPSTSLKPVLHDPAPLNVLKAFCLVKDKGFLLGALQLIDSFTRFLASTSGPDHEVAVSQCLELENVLEYPVLDKSDSAAWVRIPDDFQRRLPHSEQQSELSHALRRVSELVKLLFPTIAQKELPKRRVLSASQMDRYLSDLHMVHSKKREELRTMVSTDAYINPTIPAENVLDLEEFCAFKDWTSVCRTLIASVTQLEGTFKQLLAQNGLTIPSYTNIGEPPLKYSSESSLSYALLQSSNETLALEAELAAWRERTHRPIELTLANDAMVSPGPLFDLLEIEDHSPFTLRVIILARLLSIFGSEEHTTGIITVWQLVDFRHLAQRPPLEPPYAFIPDPQRQRLPANALEFDLARQVVKLVKKTGFFVQLLVGVELSSALPVSISGWNTYIWNIVWSRTIQQRAWSTIAAMNNKVDENIFVREGRRCTLRKFENILGHNRNLVDYQKALLDYLKGLETIVDERISQKIREGARFWGYKDAARQAGVRLVEKDDALHVSNDSVTGKRDSGVQNANDDIYDVTEILMFYAAIDAQADVHEIDQNFVYLTRLVSMSKRNV